MPVRPKQELVQEMKSHLYDIDRVVDNMCRGLYQGLDFDKSFSQLFAPSLLIVFGDDFAEMIRFMNYLDRQNLFDFIQDKFMEKREGIINAYNE